MLTKLQANILNNIDQLRCEAYSCSLGSLSRRMRMSKDMLRHQCQLLKSAGHVRWADGVAGSLVTQRSIDGNRYQIELMDQLAIHVQHEVFLKCESIAVAVVWPELIPDHAKLGAPLPPPDTQPVAGVGGGTPSPVPGAEAGQVDRVDPDLYCEVCDRTFKTKLAISGHRRSKAHLAAAS